MEIVSLTNQDAIDQENTFTITNAENTMVHTLVKASKSDNDQIKITDMCSRVVAYSKVQVEKGNNTINIPASIANGNIYIATLTMQGKMYSVKFLKK